MDLPSVTTGDEIDRIAEVLYSKIKEIPISEAVKLSKPLFSQNNINTFNFIGFTTVNDNGIKLTQVGRSYHNADATEGLAILKNCIKQIKIYDTTLEYFHHNKTLSPTRTDTGTYWHEHFSDKVQSLTEEDLTSAVVFFLKLCEKSGLGKYINAGRGRETRIDLDNVQLAEYVTAKVKITKVEISAPVVEEKPAPSPDATASIITITEEKAAELSPSSLRALGKLEIGLSWKELDSDGAKKLIIEKLDDLQQENTVLKAKVEKMAGIDKMNAVLEERNKTLSNNSLVRTSVNSVGGVILGASFSLSSLGPQIVGIALGAILITLSIFFRDKDESSKTEKDT